MNALDLPPRRTLPDDVRERMRVRVNAEVPRSRNRAPLFAAAAVVVLAAGSVVVSQSTGGTPAGHRVAQKPPSAMAVVPGSDPQLTVSGPGAQSDKDLDHCWDAIKAGQRVADYAPRSRWRPAFTVTRARALGTGSLMRFTMFHEPDGTPGVCVVTEMLGGNGSRSATVSDPKAEPIALVPPDIADIRATFYDFGIMAGVATGIDSMMFSTTVPHPDTGVPTLTFHPPVLRDGLFLVEIGELDPGTAVAGGHPDATSFLTVTGFDSAGHQVTNARWPYDAVKDPLVGPSLTY